MNTPTIRDLINEFLENFCIKVKEGEDHYYVDLMMDNHDCIIYQGVEYYVPESSILYDEDDHLLRDLLTSTYPF